MYRHAHMHTCTHTFLTPRAGPRRLSSARYTEELACIMPNVQRTDTYTYIYIYTCI